MQWEILCVKTSETTEEVFRVDSNDIEEVKLDGEVVVVEFVSKSEKMKKIFNFDSLLQERECYEDILGQLGMKCGK